MGFFKTEPHGLSPPHCRRRAASPCWRTWGRGAPREARLCTPGWYDGRV